MQLNVTTLSKKEVSSLTVSEQVFGCPFIEPLVHQVVTAQLAAARQGTKAQKTRTEVRGGGAKPWLQKGTGRARAGTIRSPLWRGGGIIFAAKPRDHSQKVNVKMQRKALSSVLSELVRQDRLVIIDDIKLKAPKTKEVIALLEKTNMTGRVLIVVDKENRELELGARNLHPVEVASVNAVDVSRLVAADKVMMTVEALKKLEGKLV